MIFKGQTQANPEPTDNESIAVNENECSNLIKFNLINVLIFRWNLTGWQDSIGSCRKAIHFGNEFEKNFAIYCAASSNVTKKLEIIRLTSRVFIKCWLQTDLTVMSSFSIASSK